MKESPLDNDEDSERSPSKPTAVSIRGSVPLLPTTLSRSCGTLSGSSLHAFPSDSTQRRESVSCTQTQPELGFSLLNLTCSERSLTYPASNGTNRSTLSTSGSVLCRICHGSTTREPLISPCCCKGSLAYVHLSCLERWLNQTSRNYCELCLFQFNAVQNRRYGLMESFRVWIRHPQNRSTLQSDLLITALLTVVTAGLVSVCLFGMQYFIMESEKIGVPNLWTKMSICFFLAIVLIAYLFTLYLLIKDHFIPWYYWWRHTVNVRLVLNTLNEQP